MTKKNFLTITVSLICLLFPQESFSQDILGKWECPEGMYQYWGYKTGKAHITFKKDNIFILKIKGRRTRQKGTTAPRPMSVKVKGFYMVKNDSMYFYVTPKHIKCNVTAGKEDPALSPAQLDRQYPSHWSTSMKRKYEDYDFYTENIRSEFTWDSRELFYDSELLQCEFKRIAVINQMLDFFQLKRYSFKEISQDSLRLGKKFIITRD